ncbi:MAG TPA: hypothetical protein PLZ52_10745 [Bacteroidales bacterium]|nr:hypothetical protein [Bacteroidales bacterium]
MLSTKPHNCRSGCAACCIGLSISSPIPGMPQGKRAGEWCIHLTPDLLCDLIDSPTRPEVCINFNFDPIICGSNREEALRIMAELES